MRYESAVYVDEEALFEVLNSVVSGSQVKAAVTGQPAGLVKSTAEDPSGTVTTAPAGGSGNFDSDSFPVRMAAGMLVFGFHEAVTAAA